MTSKEFDYWYDNKVKEITKSLPNPKDYDGLTMHYPIVFGELYNITIKYTGLNEFSNTIAHEISFKKVWDKIEYIWVRY